MGKSLAKNVNEIDPGGGESNNNEVPTDEQIVTTKKSDGGANQVRVTQMFLLGFGHISIVFYRYFFKKYTFCRFPWCSNLGLYTFSNH
jgi:hypothetical protein